jgi:hypothetical protein
VSSVNSKIAKNFIKIVLLVSVSIPAFAWEVDFSRRQTEFNKIQNSDRLPASVSDEKSMSFVTQIFEGSEPTQDVVIMNTEKGFIPETIRLKKNGNYRFHIVNVNQKEKNVSFILDAFSEHHNTIFGEEKSFTVAPKTDGVFSYQCPETAVQGKIIIFTEGERKPASN